MSRDSSESLEKDSLKPAIELVESDSVISVTYSTVNLDQQESRFSNFKTYNYPFEKLKKILKKDISGSKGNIVSKKRIIPRGSDADKKSGGKRSLKKVLLRQSSERSKKQDETEGDESVADELEEYEEEVEMVEIEGTEDMALPEEVNKLRTSTCSNVETIRETAAKLCRDYLHGAWRKISPQDIVLKKVSGGLSNLLYYVSLPPNVEAIRNEPTRVLLRIYGQVNGERALETLITESVIFTLLSESQKGPRLFGVFPGGRLEEYIQARPLKTRELADPNLSRLIAEKMAQIHSMDVPISKQPSWFWDTIERWLNTVEEHIKNDNTKALDAIRVKLERISLRDELAWLRGYLLSADSPVVFCHNDMQEGNILVREEIETFQKTHMTDMSSNLSQTTLSEIEPELPIPVPISPNLTSDSLVVIDFEYCSYNYRGFELANHFNEWMYDYSNENPPFFYNLPEDEHPTPKHKENLVTAYMDVLKSAPNYIPRTRDTVEHILSEIEAFTLASHYFWGLWSLVHSTTVEIDFDYWVYGEARFDAYYKHKEKIIKSCPVPFERVSGSQSLSSS